ncbi:MAG: hypothetical protein IPG67_11940 [Acidobacteria bacterium]|nr:hypothetical protein [Acidobacteriota bacterium]
MKTIYRQLFFAAILTVLLGAGSHSVMAQDACDAATAAYAEWTALFEKKDLASRKLAVEKGKEFVTKYGSCEPTKDGGIFIKDSLPGMEAVIKRIEERNYENALLKRFDDGMKAKNWDDVYASGKEVVSKYVDIDVNSAADTPEVQKQKKDRADKYRAAKLVLGSIGLDETGKSPSVTKWNEDTIRYAKSSIADIEAGKTFAAWGVAPFVYKGKDDALGWMNYTIGYILFNDRKDKKGAADYMYKASQIASDTKTNPVVYSSIASFYVLDLNKNIEELKALPAPVDADTPEVKQQKVDAIKDKTGMVNGAAERVMDAYARAFKFAPMTPASKAYRDSLKASFKQIYDIRFQKPDATTPTVDTWIDMAAAKPIVNPSTPITPVLDAEKASTTTATPGPGTPVTVKPSTPSGTAPVKPAGPAAKPTPAGAKPAGAKPAVAAVKKKAVR